MILLICNIEVKIIKPSDSPSVTIFILLWFTTLVLHHSCCWKLSGKASSRRLCSVPDS